MNKSFNNEDIMEDITNEKDKEKELGSVVELSIDEINNLTVDKLLEYRFNNTTIKVITSTNPFNVKWNKDGLEIAKDREELIINSIRALMLKLDLESNSNKYYNDSLKNIFKLQKEINNKDILYNILDLNLENLDKEDKKEDTNKIGFKDIFNLITKVNKTNDKLQTIGGKVDYIVNKLDITDITEYIFVILAIDAMQEED